MGRIFISHAVVDKSLVDSLVDLLQTGLDISRTQIFCSSIHGMHIRTGMPFAEYIKAQLTSADFAIMVISQPYFESAFCLCELGAAWILGRETFPLLVPPMDFEQLKAVSRDVQSKKIGDKDSLNDLKDRLQEAGIGNPNTTRWEAKRDAFLLGLPAILSKLPTSTTVPAAEFKKLEVRYDETQNIVVEHQTNISELEGRIEKLKDAKDKDEVKAILDENKTEWEKFEALTDQFQAAARGLPNIVLEIMYKTYVDGHYIVDTGWGTEQLWNRINTARERGLLKVDDDTVSPDNGSPKIKPVDNALTELQRFVDNPPCGFTEEYEEKYSHQFRLALRDFWEQHLGLLS